MKENLSEIISEFIKEKRESESNPEKKDSDEIKTELLKKVIQRKFGKK